MTNLQREGVSMQLVDLLLWEPNFLEQFIHIADQKVRHDARLHSCVQR